MPHELIPNKNDLVDINMYETDSNENYYNNSTMRTNTGSGREIVPHGPLDREIEPTTNVEEDCQDNRIATIDVQYQSRQQQNNRKKTSNATTLRTIAVHEEQTSRFLSPISWTVVTIPEGQWPDLFVGKKSNNETSNYIYPVVSVLQQDAISIPTYELEFRYINEWWQQMESVLTKGKKLLPTVSASGRNAKRQPITALITLDDDQNEWNEKLKKYSLIKCVVNNYSRNRIQQLQKIDKITIDECKDLVDACMPAIQSLCLSRVTWQERVDHVTHNFSELTKQITVTIVDIKQCENLLRRSIRDFCLNDMSYIDRITLENTSLVPVQQFDRETALREVTSYEIEITLKEYVAFLSALQTRKWYTVQRVTKLRKRKFEYEASVTPLNDAIASDVYRQTIKQLQNEQASVSHLSQQIEMMKQLIQRSRKILAQLYNTLYNVWQETSDSVEKLSDTLRAYQVQVPRPIRVILDREKYTLDFFRALEIMRNTNTLIVTRVEDTYDQTYDELIGWAASTAVPILTVNQTTTTVVDDGTTQSACNEAFTAAILHQTSPTNQNQNQTTTTTTTQNQTTTTTTVPIPSVTPTIAPTMTRSTTTNPIMTTSENRKEIIHELNQLNRTLLQARENYRDGRWDQAPTDIREMVMSFLRMTNKRINTLLTETAKLPPGRLTSTSAHLYEEDQLQATEQGTTGQTLEIDLIISRWLNARESDYMANVQIDWFDEVERSDDNKVLHLRPLGNFIQILRDAQDTFDIICLLRILDMEFDKSLSRRFARTNNTNVNETSERSRWNERRLIGELEEATRSTFHESIGTWDRMIARVQVYEREAIQNIDEPQHIRVPLSTRLQNWWFRPIDIFNFTQIHARFTQIDTNGELMRIQQRVARYAYLLSWLLQIRTYITKKQVNLNDLDYNEYVQTRQTRYTTGLYNDLNEESRIEATVAEAAAQLTKERKRQKKIKERNRRRKTKRQRRNNKQDSSDNEDDDDNDKNQDDDESLSSVSSSSQSKRSKNRKRKQDQTKSQKRRKKQKRKTEEEEEEENERKTIDQTENNTNENNTKNNDRNKRNKKLYPSSAIDRDGKRTVEQNRQRRRELIEKAREKDRDLIRKLNRNGYDMSADTDLDEPFTRPVQVLPPPETLKPTVKEVHNRTTAQREADETELETKPDPERERKLTEAKEILAALEDKIEEYDQNLVELVERVQGDIENTRQKEKRLAAERRKRLLTNLAEQSQPSEDSETNETTLENSDTINTEVKNINNIDAENLITDDDRTILLPIITKPSKPSLDITSPSTSTQPTSDIDLANVTTAIPSPASPQQRTDKLVNIIFPSTDTITESFDETTTQPVNEPINNQDQTRIQQEKQWYEKVKEYTENVLENPPSTLDDTESNKVRRKKRSRVSNTTTNAQDSDGEPTTTRKRKKSKQWTQHRRSQQEQKEQQEQEQEQHEQEQHEQEERQRDEEIPLDTYEPYEKRESSNDETLVTNASNEQRQRDFEQRNKRKRMKERQRSNEGTSSSGEETLGRKEFEKQRRKRLEGARQTTTSLFLYPTTDLSPDYNIVPYTTVDDESNQENGDILKNARENAQQNDMQNEKNRKQRIEKRQIESTSSLSSPTTSQPRTIKRTKQHTKNDNDNRTRATKRKSYDTSSSSENEQPVSRRERRLQRDSRTKRTRRQTETDDVKSDNRDDNSGRKRKTYDTSPSSANDDEIIAPVSRRERRLQHKSKRNRGSSEQQSDSRQSSVYLAQDPTLRSMTTGSVRTLETLLLQSENTPSDITLRTLNEEMSSQMRRRQEIADNLNRTNQKLEEIINETAEQTEQ